MSTQSYIGSPNGVVVCVDRIAGQRVTGRLYHRYSEKAIPFFSAEQAVFLMEELFDRLQFPYPSTAGRTFTGEKKLMMLPMQERIMKDGELLSKHGDLGSFIVRVQHRQNSSWQGTLTWMEQDQTIRFRSIWEMIKLIESAIETNGAREPEEPPSWNSGEA